MLVLVRSRATCAPPSSSTSTSRPAHRRSSSLEPGWTGGVPGLALAWAGAVVLAQRPPPPGRVGARGLRRLVGPRRARSLVADLRDRWSDPPLAGASTAHFVYQRLGAWLLLVLPLLLLLYPDGRLPERPLAEARPDRAGGHDAAAHSSWSPYPPASPRRASGRRAARAAPPLDLDLIRLPLPDDVWTVAPAGRVPRPRGEPGAGPRRRRAPATGPPPGPSAAGCVGCSGRRVVDVLVMLTV